VSVLLQNAAIEQVPNSSLGPGFYSRLFFRIDLTSLPQGWKEEIVPFLLEQSITYERATT
jgi:hypothetical protein